MFNPPHYTVPIVPWGFDKVIVSFILFLRDAFVKCPSALYIVRLGEPPLY